jgi:hypothetical protein
MTLTVSTLRHDKRLGGLFMNQAVITSCHPQICGIFSNISLISQYPHNGNETRLLSTRATYKLQVCEIKVRGIQEIGYGEWLNKERNTIPVTGRGGPYVCETSGLPHFLIGS